MADEVTRVRADAPDDHDPAQERQMALRVAYMHNVEGGREPYMGVHIATRGEIFWIMREHQWSGGRDIPDKEVINLRGVDLRGTNLRGLKIDYADLSGAILDQAVLVDARLRGVKLREASLREADLTGAHLNGADASGARFDRAKLLGAELDTANLSGAVLGRADLTGASVDRANLSNTSLGEANLSLIRADRSNLTNARLRKAIVRGARFRGANFTGARLWEADFADADLIGCDLSGAHLRSANLAGADLRGAQMSVTTALGRVVLDGRTQLGDIIWNNAPLIEVDWTQIPRLGDEIILKKATTREERALAYHQAARAYRVLVTALKAQGVALAASTFRLREQQLERKAARIEGRLGSWLFSGLLDTVSGYGERPGRAFNAYVSIVALFAVVYWGATNFLPSHSSALTWYEALVLSLMSFHGRGFFPATLSLGEPIVMVGAVEAVLGLFIELIFVATFSRRFLSE